MSLKVRRDVWVGDMHFGIELGIDRQKKVYSSPGVYLVYVFNIIINYSLK